MQAEAETIQRKDTRSPQRSKGPIKDEEWAKSLQTIVSQYVLSDKPTRDRQVRKWRKQMCYWDGLQFLWWSDVVHDWRTPDQYNEAYQGTSDDRVEIDPALYAKVVNIYKAHGEVIIAAMSSTTPKVLFPPDDADNPDDVLTAKAYTKLAEVICRHNYAELLLIKALYLLYNQGLVCAYNETHQDEAFGQVETPIEEEVPVNKRAYSCPDCGFELGQEEIPEAPMMEDVEDTEQETVLPANNSLPAIQETVCPTCSNEFEEHRVIPQVEEFQTSEMRQTGVDVQDKCREILTFWGPLNVLVPNWVRRQADVPYLILETEEHYAKLQEIYPEIARDIKPTPGLENTDRGMRTPTAYEGERPAELVTVKRCWLRPWGFNTLGLDEGANEEMVGQLKAKFPKGCYVVIIGDDLVAEAIPDRLDDHWTLTHHPLADSLHAEPMGAGEMHIQELTNELVNLTVENIEHSIPEVFADSDTLDFDQYNKSEARPGMVYPVTKKPGESIGNSFHEVKGGTLSREVELFADRLEKFAQFVVGSLPSVFGGQIEGGSNTAREYEISRAQALQRLATTWKLITVWWTQVIAKSVKAYANNMMEDERYVDKKGGSFINVWVRQADTEGRVGQAYAEASESLPVTWNEKKSMVMSLLQYKDPLIMEVFAHPENSSFVARMLGLSELYIPGDEDRNKQLNEIAKLIQEEPMEFPTGMIGPDGQPQTEVMSSVQVEPDLDNHRVEAEACAVWLKSEVGQDMKETNPAAYMNVLAHYREHKMFEAQAQATQQAREMESGASSEENMDVEEVGA